MQPQANDAAIAARMAALIAAVLDSPRKPGPRTRAAMEAALADWHASQPKLDLVEPK